MLLNEDNPAQKDTSTTHNIVISQCTYVVVSRMYKPRSAPNSALYITKLLEDGVGDCDSAGYVRTLCHTQDVVDPLLFTTSGEEHVNTKEAIKGNSSSDNQQNVSLKPAFLLLAVALQKPSTKSKTKDHQEVLSKCLAFWKEWGN